MDFSKPGPNKRVCAFLIDSTIGQICGVIISLVLARDIGYIIWVVIILFKDCLDGQSVGKYLVNTKIIDENNLPAKPSKTIIRNIFMIIPFFPIIEYFRMLRDKEEGKRIGDNVAKTKVSDLKPQIQDNIFLWISIVIVIVIVVIQLGIGYRSYVDEIKQHPKLLKQ